MEESFEQGLSSDSAHSKFSTPKETTAYQLDLENLDSSKDSIKGSIKSSGKGSIKSNKDEQPSQPQQPNKADQPPEEPTTSAYSSLNKQYTKHCTEECTKQDCAHTIRYSESYERILKIISNYNSKQNKTKDGNDLAEEDEEDEENDEEEEEPDGEEEDEGENDEEQTDNEAYKNDLHNEHQRDFQNEFKQLYSSTNQNIYRLNEFFKEELTKSLDPTMNNEQYVYRSLSETNLNYSLDYPPNNRHRDSFQVGAAADSKLRNRTFSSDTINNQLRSIEKDLATSNPDNLPIKGGIDGRNVRTFDEMLSHKLSDDYANLPAILFKSENPTKRPFLRKGDGLKRFEGRSTSEPRGKLCRLRNQKLRQLKQQSVEKRVSKKRTDSNRKLPDPKRIDYLAQPKCWANRELGELDKENEMKLNQLMSKTPDHLHREYVTSNLSEKSAFRDLNYVERKPKRKTNLPSKEAKETLKVKNKKATPDNEQKPKKAKVHLVSKISVNKSQDYQGKRQATSDLVVEKEWDKKVGLIVV